VLGFGKGFWAVAKVIVTVNKAFSSDLSDEKFVPQVEKSKKALIRTFLDTRSEGDDLGSIS